jgi:hypothetical protein
MEQKQKTFRVMEWHRGEFIPLKSTKPDGTKGEDRIVKITEESADVLNADFSELRGQGLKIKYLPLEKGKVAKKDTIADDDVKKDLAAKYKELAGTKAYHAWTAEELTDKINELTKA